MKLADELFIKHTLIENTLLPYGFQKDGDLYFYNSLIHNDEFELQIVIKNQKISAKLIEKEFHEEYTQINMESTGGFINSLKEECGKVLLNIRDKCFKKESFIFPQTNRIAESIQNRYGVLPEIMKFGSASNSVFRNSVTRKWIGLVMYGKKRNIIGDSEEKVESLSLNFKEEADLYIGEKGIYHPYQKKNKNWVVMIMDDTLSDQKIMDYVSIGYEKSQR